MAFNFMGDLYKRDIVKEIQKRGFGVKSVNALNKIMEKMGLIVRYANGWMTTDEGAKFSIFEKKALNEGAWHAELIDAIVNFLTKEG